MWPNKNANPINPAKLVPVRRSWILAVPTAASVRRMAFPVWLDANVWKSAYVVASRILEARMSATHVLSPATSV